MQEPEWGTHTCPAVQPRRIDKTGSFYKLIHTFVSEIGELKNEFMKTTEHVDNEPDDGILQGLEDQVGEIFLQSPLHGGFTAKDSGYVSLCRRMSPLDRLRHTHSVWLLLDLSKEETCRILLMQPPGVFLVRRSRNSQKKVVSVRLEDASDGPICDFPVRESQYTFSLEGSGIGFADLFSMVSFYCMSRDILPFTLRLPEAIASAKTQTELRKVAQLGAGFWDSPMCTRRPLVRQRARSSSFNSDTLGDPHTGVQFRSALCILNPLFHQEPPAQKDPSAPQPTPVPLQVPPPHSSSQHLSAPQEQRKMPEMVYWIRPGFETDTGSPVSQVPPTPPETCPKRPLDQSIQKALYRCLARTLYHSTTSEEDGSNPPCGQEEASGPEERRESEQWLSDMSISTSSSDSLDRPSCQRSSRGMTDSSVEEEEGEDDDKEEDEEPVVLEVESSQEAIQPPLKMRKRPIVTVPAVLQMPLHKMSSALGSLVTPERRAIRRVQRLAQSKTSYFGCLVQDYVSFVQENHGCHTSGLDLLQTLRQFMTQTKAYLFQSTELNPPLHSIIPEDQIDQLLERALQKAVLKPLKNTVEAALQSFQERSGEWRQLKENLALAKSKQPQELGVDGNVVPDAVAIEKIRHKFHNMHKMYSPEKKVLYLLQVCKLIYTILEGNTGKSCGADDFLPMLAYTLAQCNMPQLDTEIQYMMELLDPSLLHGEGGYYLTSAYGAMSLIKNLREEQAAQVLISETQSTLRQWHRRRTTCRNVPFVEDLQSYLRVVLQDVGSCHTVKTLRVAPCSTTEEVCQMCAERFRVPDPEHHALFLLIDESSESIQQLAPDTRPQKIKVEIHSRPQPPTFHFVYRRVSNDNLRSPADCYNKNFPSPE